MSSHDDEPFEESEEPFEEPKGDGEEQPFTGLPPEERETVEADIEDLESMRAAFEPQGAKGVVIACADCGSNHFYDWELLRESLHHMLDTGEPRMHEPAYQPREDDYVAWDYGKGYVDALSDSGLESGPHLEVTSCGWCETPVESHFTFCPKCGRPMAVLRLYRELIERGMDDREVRSILLKAGFEPFG